MKIVKPDSNWQCPEGIGIFLAGTIDMGNSRDWQSDVCNQFTDQKVTFYNPRRDNWNNDWEDDSDEFINQVNWELGKLDKCKIIFMNFEPNSASPISLLELGLYAASGKMIVVCPHFYHRKGNVDIVCIRNNIPVFNSIDEGIRALKTKLLQFRDNII